RGTGKNPTRTGVLATQCVRKAPVPVLLTDDVHRGPYKHVVCAVDFSETSKLAAEQAIRMAKVDGSRLDFIHVYISPKIAEYPDSGLVVSYEPLEDFAPLMRRQLTEFLEPYRANAEGVEFNERVIERFSISHGMIDDIESVG